MPRLPIFRLGKEPEKLALPEMIAAAPSIAIEGLAVGVDNLRHDVALSPRFVEAARAHVMRLIVRHGELEGLLAAETPLHAQGPSWMRSAVAGTARGPKEKSDWKPLLAELLLTTLNRAKREEKISVDLLARLAVIKFLRTEMNQQFAQVLERCRVLLKNYEGIRQGKGVEYRERVAAFQVRKKIILRKTGQDLFETLREIEKETLARTRRSLFGEAKAAEAKAAEAKTAEIRTGEAQAGDTKSGLGSYGLFLNRLAFSEDGRDDYLCAEHYVMLGNWDRDADRYPRLQDVVWGFTRRCTGRKSAARRSARGCALRKMLARSWVRARRRFHGGRRGPAGAPRELGAFARRRAGDGVRDRLLPHRAAAQRVRAANQSAAIEERADFASGM